MLLTRENKYLWVMDDDANLNKKRKSNNYRLKIMTYVQWLSF